MPNGLWKGDCFPPLPKDIYVWILETCEFITLHGKSSFEDVIKLRILRWEDHPVSRGCAQRNHKDTYQRGQSRKRDVMTETEVRD